MVGIYKITSPEEKVYIGKSINIESRIKNYSVKGSAKQVKLNKSFLKHGIDNHIFEIIELCHYSELSEKEIFWQKFYDVSNKGLNSVINTGTITYLTTDQIERINLREKEHFNIKTKISKKDKSNTVRFECRALKELIPIVREYAKLISEQELLKQKKLTATAQKQL